MKRVRYFYIALVHALVVVMLLKSDFLDKASIKFGVSKSPEISTYYKRITRYHERMDGSVPDDAVIFIGDSITQGLATSAIYAPSVNYGIGSDTTLGVLERLTIYPSIERAKAVVLAIGINDLSRRGNDEILSNYTSIIESLPANTLIIISAILPVDERIDRVGERNERSTDINAQLRILANQSSNVVFSDATSALKDSSGNLYAKYHVGDGVHLNTEGYAEWIKVLRSTIESHIN